MFDTVLTKKQKLVMLSTMPSQKNKPSTFSWWRSSNGQTQLTSKVFDLVLSDILMKKLEYKES